MLATTKQIRSLEDKIRSLEKRIFKKRVRSTYDSILTSYWASTMWGEPVEPKPLEEDFFDNLEKVENRQALIMKHFGLEFKMVKGNIEHETIVSAKRKVGRPSKK